jgi:hypothetical protein
MEEKARFTSGYVDSAKPIVNVNGSRMASPFKQSSNFFGRMELSIAIAGRIVGWSHVRYRDLNRAAEA